MVHNGSQRVKRLDVLQHTIVLWRNEFCRIMIFSMINVKEITISKCRENERPQASAKTISLPVHFLRSK